MSEIVLAKVTSKGQMTIPRPIREEAGIKPGDYVAVSAIDGGVLIAKAEVSSRMQAQYLLYRLVTGIGREAEKRGITEDEHLDAIIEEIQERGYQERYGKQE